MCDPAGLRRMLILKPTFKSDLLYDETINRMLHCGDISTRQNLFFGPSKHQVVSMKKVYKYMSRESSQIKEATQNKLSANLIHDCHAVFKTGHSLNLLDFLTDLAPRPGQS